MITSSTFGRLVAFGLIALCSASLAECTRPFNALAGSRNRCADLTFDLGIKVGERFVYAGEADAGT